MLNIVDILFPVCYFISQREQKALSINTGERGAMSFMKNLKLKLARMEKDISQTELANRVGVTRQTIGMVESGDYNPTLNLCIQICKVLDKTLNDLFWEDSNDEMVSKK